VSGPDIVSFFHYEPAVSHTFSGGMLAETERGISGPGRPRLEFVLELSLPSGTRRYCKVGGGSKLRGAFEPRVLRWGNIQRAVNVRTSNLIDQEVEVELSDAGDRASERRQLAQEFARYRTAIRGITAIIRAVGQDVPGGVTDAESSVRFNGKLVGLPREIAPMVWRVRLRTNDGALKYGLVPRTKITSTDWPSAHADALNKFAPVVFGTWDSTGLTSQGLLPTYYVDTAGFRYVWTMGHGKQVRNVFSSASPGTPLSTSLYTLTYPIVNGVQWSVIDFTTGHGNETITLDADGLTDQPDGSGALLTNPADQARFALTQLVFNDWRSGAHYADTMLDLRSWQAAADFFRREGHQGSKYLGGSAQTEALQIPNEFAAQYETRFFWTNAGTLGIVIFDPCNPVINSLMYSDAQWVRGNENELGGFSLDWDEQGICREIDVEYVPSEADGKLFQTQKVSDLTVPERVTVSHEMDWSAARII